jgi:hypothetical protein
MEDTQSQKLAITCFVCGGSSHNPLPIRERGLNATVCGMKCLRKLVEDDEELCARTLAKMTVR